MKTTTQVIAKSKTTPTIATILLTVFRNAGTQCRFVSMVTETPVKIKKSCPHKNVIKLSKRNGLINANFVKSVERKMAAKLGMKPSDVKYEAGSTWYEHETTSDGKPSCVCQHKKDTNKKYLQYFPHKSLWTKYVDGNGNEIPFSELKEHFYAQKKSEFKPLVITLGMDSIRSLRHRKITVSNV